MVDLWVAWDKMGVDIKERQVMSMYFCQQSRLLASE